MKNRRKFVFLESGTPILVCDFDGGFTRGGGVVPETFVTMEPMRRLNCNDVIFVVSMLRNFAPLLQKYKVAIAKVVRVDR